MLAVTPPAGHTWLQLGKREVFESHRKMNEIFCNIEKRAGSNLKAGERKFQIKIGRKEVKMGVKMKRQD